MAENFEFFATCQMCGSEFQMGRGIYNGKHISRYDLDVCKTCYESNWDGWAPQFEPKLLAHIKEKGIAVPQRNEKGWLPRD